jgi:choline dehydrogenase
VRSRLDNAAVLSRLVRNLEDIEVTDTEHLIELMERDINVQDHHFTPGVYQDVVSTNQLRRRSGARDYIVETIEQGYPLTLSSHSLATKVLFDQTGIVPRAYGVEYLVGEGLYSADRRYDPEQTEEVHNVTALKEVIVSGGTFNTPQL